METIQGLNTNGSAIIGTGIAFSILTTVAVGLRFLSKKTINAPFGVDDWLLLVALLIYLVAEALIIRADVVGREATSTDDSRYRTYMQLTYVYSVFYWPIAAIVQVSLLFLYRRLFISSPVFKFISSVLIFLVVIAAIIASVIEIGFPGHPLDYFFSAASDATWNVYYTTMWLGMSIFELAVDIVVLILPIREILQLQLCPKKKFFVSLIFLLGGFVIVTGIVRIVELYNPSGAEMDLTQGDIWFNVHLGTSIICVCLPTLRPIILRSSEVIMSHRASTPMSPISPISPMSPISRERSSSTKRTRPSYQLSAPSGEKTIAGHLGFDYFAEARLSSSSRNPEVVLMSGGGHDRRLGPTQVKDIV